MEHPFGGSWGYQVTGYFAPVGRFGGPDDLRYFVDRLHQHGHRRDPRLGARRTSRATTHGAGALRRDGALRARGPAAAASIRTGARCVFNFGRNEVRNFLISNALFWLSEYHVDGLRVDAVASMLYLDYSRKEGEWVPNALRRAREPGGDRSSCAS